MSEWNVGSVILNEYVIEKELGRGGMGRVWLVKSQSTGRHYAVKQALVHDEKHRNAFLNELEAWIDLPEHPNIVPCRFLRTVGEEIVIFADYIEGGTLADWIAKGKLSNLEQILDVAIQFAWGLHAIHERGLIHQDVKPGNVLMSADGVPMVTDFGLARARLLGGDGGFVSRVQPPAQDSILVSSGGMTPAYASPEQRAGQPLSRKTDIWSWGVSVLDMFVGGVSCPYGGHIAAEVLEDLVSEQKTIDLPSSVLSIIKQCFLQIPSDRHTTLFIAANKLAEDYRNATGHEYTRHFPASSIGSYTGVFIRRAYSGSCWKDPSDWLTSVEALEADSPVSQPGQASMAHTTRIAMAVSDFSEYQQIYRRLLTLAETNQNVSKYVAELLYDMAQIHGELNDHEGEIAAYENCIRYANVAALHCDELEYAYLITARARDKIALRQRSLGKVDAAIDNYTESIAFWHKFLACTREPDSWKGVYAITLRNAAIAIRHLGDIDQAIKLYDEVIEIFNSALSEKGNRPMSDAFSMELQRTCRFKGIALRKSGFVDRAMKCYDQASAILNAFGVERTDSEYMIELARLHDARACVVPPGIAIQDYQISISLYEKLTSEYASENLLADLASARFFCCNAMAKAGNRAQALALCNVAMNDWHRVVHEMGKQEYVAEYYEVQLLRASLLLDTGNEEMALCDANRIQRELDDAIRQTGSMKLKALLQKYF